jgi:hypothetical protein
VGFLVVGGNGGTAVVAVDGDVVGDEETERRAGEHGDREAELMSSGGRGGNHLDDAAGVLIDPATRVRCHLECGWHVQQVPAAVDFREDALAVAAEEAEIRVGGGEEAVDADVALGDHRVEDTGHPRGGSEGGFIRCQGSAAAQYVAVRTQRFEFLRLEHDVAAVAGEEGEELIVLAFGVAVFAAEEGVSIGFIEIHALQ